MPGIFGQRLRRQKDTNNVASAGLSGATVFIIAAITAITGFVVGTRSNDLYASIAPVFGIKASSSVLDTTELQNTYRKLKANFDGQLDEKKLEEGAQRGLVQAAGDKYTLYMNADEAKQFESDLSGDIGGGIGAEIGQRNNQAVILRTLPGNPAAAAGLNTGDVILEVDGTSTQDLTVDQVVTKIRGKVDTEAKLKVLRGGSPLDFTVKRAMITSPSVRSEVVDGIGILTISRFDDQTGSLARKAAEGFKQQGVTGVILDLRSNGGGYVTAAQDVAGIWLDNKLVVTEKTGDKVIDSVNSTSKPILAGVPTVVLVNSGTASASEIVSGAFKDYKIATLVGEKTFGKGSVQNVLELSGGAVLKVTIAKWYTPNGQNINHEGITPDTTVELKQTDLDKGVDPQIEAAKAALKK